MISLCYAKYGIALFVALAVLLIYSSEDFESLKTNFLIIIGLEMLCLLYIDYAMENEITNLKSLIIKPIKSLISKPNEKANSEEIIAPNNLNMS